MPETIEPELNPPEIRSPSTSITLYVHRWISENRVLALVLGMFSLSFLLLLLVVFLVVIIQFYRIRSIYQQVLDGVGP